MKSFSRVLDEIPNGRRLALLTPLGSNLISTTITGERWTVESILDIQWLAVPFSWRREPHGALTALDIGTLQRRAFFAEVGDDE